MKINKNLLLFFILLLILPLAVKAGIVDDAVSNLRVAGNEAGFSDQTSLPVTIARWINGFLMAFGILATYYLITAGFTWMTSGGNAEKVQAAKSTIKNVMYGLILMAISYSLVQFVLRALYDTTGLS